MNLFVGRNSKSVLHSSCLTDTAQNRHKKVDNPHSKREDVKNFCLFVILGNVGMCANLHLLSKTKSVVTEGIRTFTTKAPC